MSSIPSLHGQKRITVPWIKSQKGHQRITVLTAYDYPTAVYLDEAGVDILLVGDSVATVLYGEPDTLSITVDDMLRHCVAVSRGAKRSLVVGDLPFMSYQISAEQALATAGRFLKEGRVQAVKLEGGVEIAPTVRALTRAGIPVVGHIGLTPQSINTMGSYRTHGKTPEERSFLLESAVALADAGAFAVVLECVESTLASEITQKIPVPTIGIGSSTVCDGEVLVIHDLVGLTVGHIPKFVNPEASLRLPLKEAVAKFIQRTRKPATLPKTSDGFSGLAVKI